MEYDSPDFGVVENIKNIVGGKMIKETAKKAIENRASPLLPMGISSKRLQDLADAVRETADEMEVEVDVYVMMKNNRCVYVLYKDGKIWGMI